jgi:hypothetical protein
VGQHGPERGRRADDLLEHRRAIDLFAQREILAQDAVFGALALVDVSPGGIPPDDMAVVVANRVVADQEPAILPVFAAHALLGFKRFAAPERRQAFLLESRQITRMEASDARVIGRYFFKAEPGVVERECIGAEGASARCQDGDGVRNGVEYLPQLFVCRGQFTSPLLELGPQRASVLEPNDGRRRGRGRRRPREQRPRRVCWVLKAREERLAVVQQNIPFPIS